MVAPREAQEKRKLGAHRARTRALNKSAGLGDVREVAQKARAAAPVT
jgi:hypothetical protein